MSSFFDPYRNFYNANTIYINSNGEEFNPEVGGEIFKPKEGFQAEVGGRYTFKSLIQASASVFYIKRKNETKNIGTVEVADPNDPSRVITKTITGQVGQTVSKGFDLEVRLFPAKNLMVAMGYAYTDARAAKLKKNPYMESEPQEGLKVTGVPENTFYGMASYTIPGGWFKKLSFNATVSYMDKLYRDALNTRTFPSYWLTDVGVSYPLSSGIRLSLNVNNLFSEDYIMQALGNQLTPSMPRNFLLSVSYSLK